MRIFLDVNILFSAAKSDGAIRELLRLLHAAHHELCADGYVVAEARRNLERKGAGDLQEFERVLGRVESGAASTASLPEVDNVLPAKDRPVLSAAIRMRCDALVTGDQSHFGRLYGKKVAGVAIHSPRSLWEAIR